MTILLEQYQRRIELGQRDDAHQRSVLLALQTFLDQGRASPPSSTMVALDAIKVRTACRHLSVGSVGSGKTSLMDFFFEAIPTTHKRRWHFMLLWPGCTSNGGFSRGIGSFKKIVQHFEKVVDGWLWTNFCQKHCRCHDLKRTSACAKKTWRGGDSNFQCASRRSLPSGSAATTFLTGYRLIQHYYQVLSLIQAWDIVRPMRQNIGVFMAPAKGKRILKVPKRPYSGFFDDSSATDPVSVGKPKRSWRLILKYSAERRVLKKII